MFYDPAIVLKTTITNSSLQLAGDAWWHVDNDGNGEYVSFYYKGPSAKPNFRGFNFKAVFEEHASPEVKAECNERQAELQKRIFEFARALSPSISYKELRSIDEIKGWFQFSRGDFQYYKAREGDFDTDSKKTRSLRDALLKDEFIKWVAKNPRKEDLEFYNGWYGFSLPNIAVSTIRSSPHIDDMRSLGNALGRALEDDERFLGLDIPNPLALTRLLKIVMPNTQWDILNKIILERAQKSKEHQKRLVRQREMPTDRIETADSAGVRSALAEAANQQGKTRRRISVTGRKTGHGPKAPTDLPQGGPK